MVTKKLCDKCGEEVKENNLWRTFIINYGEGYDLCKKCNMEFKKWIRVKEND